MYWNSIKVALVQVVKSRFYFKHIPYKIDEKHKIDCKKKMKWTKK